MASVAHVASECGSARGVDRHSAVTRSVLEVGARQTAIDDFILASGSSRSCGTRIVPGTAAIETLTGADQEARKSIDGIGLNVDAA